MNILFVCTGNTCRSPMAEYIARDEAEKRGLDMEISSAGFTDDGAPASINSVIACAEIGLDLSEHVSKIITRDIADKADVIFAMTEAHAAALSRYGVASEKLRVLGVPDPYGMPVDAYRACRDRIKAEICRFFDSLEKGIEIIPMKAEHAAKIAELEKICFTDPWSEKEIACEVENPAARFFVAMCGDEIAGYAGMMYAADFAGVCNIAVVPEYRRKGIGRKLMNVLIETCRELNVAVVSLEVRESNIAAQKLYEELGFVRVGTRKGFYSSPKEDALVMNLELV